MDWTDEPKNSKNMIRILGFISLKNCCYLVEGTGNPCAGHKNASE